MRSSQAPEVGKRTYIVFAFLLIFGVALILRLGFLQIINHGFYKALAQGQYQIPNIEKGERGNIFIKGKDNVLRSAATTIDIPFVFIIPMEIEEPETAKDFLSETLGLSKEFIEEHLSAKESLFEVLKKEISNEEEQAIKEADLSGVYVQKERVRLYPQKEFASRILGFTNEDGEGQYGIEEYYQEHLAGKEGLQKIIRNVAGYLFSSSEDTPEDGKDLTLTIDYNIQSMAEAMLEEANENLNIKEGNIIVMNPYSGRIIALASFPNYNPNEYGKVQDLKIFQNPTIENIFEPGSVFKPITMASAIDDGVLTPETTYIDKGIVRIGGYKILNYDERIWGERSMNEVLQYSINTGAVFAQEQLGNRKFLEYMERFGIFKATGIDLAGEVYSTNRELKKGYKINFATASFGQGIEMTAMQLLRAYSALANGGKLVTPFLVEREPEISSPVISPKTALEITTMLVSVIEEGFAKKAKIPGYYIAGKTGTAQVAFSALGMNKAGYSEETIQSFMGYAPAFNPQFLVLVQLNNPATKTAEYSAMPIFRELTKYLIDYYEIPPDYEIE